MLVQAYVSSLLGIVDAFLDFVDLLLKLRAVSVITDLHTEAEALLDIIVVLLVDIVLHDELLKRVDLLRPGRLEDVVSNLAPKLHAQLMARYFISAAIDFRVVYQRYSQNWHLVYLGEPVLVNT